jgi:hypothetical protein
VGHIVWRESGIRIDVIISAARIYGRDGRVSLVIIGAPDRGHGYDEREQHQADKRKGVHVVSSSTREPAEAESRNVHRRIGR